MAFRSDFPFTGTTTGRTGPYSDADFASVMMDMLGSAGSDRINAGVVPGRNNGADVSLDVQQTSPASKAVAIKEGAAFVPRNATSENARGLNYVYNDDDTLVTVPDNTNGSGFDRIDLLVIRLNATTQLIDPVIIEGTAASSPVAPSPVRSGAIYDIVIAQITAQNLFATITNADIDTSVRDYCPTWVVKNGGTGLNSFSQASIIVGSDVDEMSELALPEGHVVVGDGTDAVSIDTRPIVLWRDSNSTTVYANSATNTVPLTNSNDDTGYLLGLGSNQFQLALGVYRVLTGIAISTANSAGTYNILSIYNASTTTHLVVGEAVTNTAQRHALRLPSYEFEVTNIAHNFVLNLATNVAGSINANASVYSGTFPAINASVILVLQRVR